MTDEEIAKIGWQLTWHYRGTLDDQGEYRYVIGCYFLLLLTNSVCVCRFCRMTKNVAMTLQKVVKTGEISGKPTEIKPSEEVVIKK